MRILIVDDSELIRRGLADILLSENEWQVCGEAKDGLEGVQKALELLPDLVLLDVSMPGLGGLETAERLRQELPNVDIIFLSQHDPVHLLPRALELGARACVDKSRLTKDLVATIKRVAADRER
jgi:DNA-binding NarL/FixJ family response regulator